MIEMRDTVAIVKGLLVGVKDYFTLKFLPSFLVPLFGFLFGFNNHTIIYGLFVLICIDFITGVASAKQLGHRIESRSAVKTAYKIAVYGLLMSSGHITETILPGMTYIEQAVTSFLALTELISILENVGKMGFAIPQRLLNQLQKWRDTSDETPVIPVPDRRVGDITRRTDEVVIPTDNER